jgi:hypothetical protein
MYWFTSARLPGRPRSRPPLPRQGEAPDEIRHDLVRRVRREIAQGVYDTEAKWEAALDRLLEHLR